MALSNQQARTTIAMVGFFYIAAVIFLLLIANASIDRVILGTVPFLVHALLFFVYIQYPKFWLMWGLPLVFAVLFILAWTSESFTTLAVIDVPPLTVLNVVLSYVANTFLVVAQRQKPKKTKQHPQKQEHRIPHKLQFQPVHEVYKHMRQHETRQQHSAHRQVSLHEQRMHHQQQLQKQHEHHQREIHRLQEQIGYFRNQQKVTQSNFEVTLRNLEAKCKALNFAIGRVYSDKRGGTRELRENLKISREFYNMFSDISTNFKPDDASDLMHVLQELHRQLLILESKETSLIPKEYLLKSKLVRDPFGKDCIIDILRKNDKDPVTQYHQETKEIVRKLIDYIHTHFMKK